MVEIESPIGLPSTRRVAIVVDVSVRILAVSHSRRMGSLKATEMGQVERHAESVKDSAYSEKPSVVATSPYGWIRKTPVKKTGVPGAKPGRWPSCSPVRGEL